MPKQYSEQELTKALLLILDRGMSPTEAEAETGIPLRTIQRYKAKHLASDRSIPVESSGMSFQTLGNFPMTVTPEAKTQLDKTIEDRAKFLEDLFEAKQDILKRIKVLTKSSENIDYLQKTLKTLTELETTVAPKGNPPPGTVNANNIFQIFNQQLINQGYEGPTISDADVVKGD